MYEEIGCKDIFESPYGLAKIYNGSKYRILSRVTEDYADLRYLPMWNIQFENGKKIMAKLEEICIADNIPAD